MSIKIYDMIMASIPWTDLSSPPAAPALLKGIAKTYNFSIIVRDFNIDFKRKFCDNDQSKFEEVQDYFLSSDTHTHQSYQMIDRFYDYVVDELTKVSARYIGISVFSVWTHKSTLEICKRLKQKNPNCQIVVGGRGLSTLPHLSIWSSITSGEKLLNFYQILSKKKIVDYTILGDAEDAIVDLFKGNPEQDFVNQNETKSATLEYPFSDFDDYELYQYVGLASKIQLPVISSKGCVRACDFCDVGAQFTRFRSKQGRRIAEEIIYLSQKYKIYEFAMTDSIINGNMKSLKEALECLADYNARAPDAKKVKLAGNWICRFPGNIKSDFFDLMYRAGVIHLTVGAEHGSDRVLKIMNKKSSVAGLLYELEHLERTGIQCILNNITGHWAETYDDFLEHLDMILKLGPLYANRTISSMMLGSGYSVLKNTPSDIERERNGLITTQDNFSFLWYTPKNPNLTIKTRLARWYILYQIAMLLKIPLLTGYSYALQMRNRLKESFQTSVDFYAKHLVENYQTCPSIELADKWQQYLSDRIKELFPTTKLTISLQASEHNGLPRLLIKHNDKILFDDELSAGGHVLNFEIQYNYDFDQITAEMTNKGPNDTSIDASGNIVADKFIKFNTFIIDRIDLLKELHYYYNNIDYVNSTGQSTQVCAGFYENDRLIMEFTAPFWRHFMEKRFDNTRAWEANSDPGKLSQLIDEVKTFIGRYKY